VLSPAVRSDKVVPVSYCRLGVATQVLASAQPAYFDLPGIVSSRYRAYDAPPCNFVVVVEKHILAGQVLPNTVLTALPRPDVSTKPPDHCIGIGGFYALLDFMFLCALGGTPTLLPNTMEGQLASVRQNIRNVQEQIVKYEQKLAAAERAGNKGVEEEVRFLRGQLLSLNNQLLSLNNQLLSLQEKENILLRSQAPSKPCLQLVRTGLPVFTSCCTPFSSAYPVAGHSF